jgi:hypothetical protein
MIYLCRLKVSDRCPLHHYNDFVIGSFQECRNRFEFYSTQMCGSCRCWSEFTEIKPHSIVCQIEQGATK